MMLFKKIVGKSTDVYLYGANEIIKRYAGYSRFLPLTAHLEHGWTAIDEALKSDLTTTKRLMLVYNKNRKKAWEQQSKIPAVIVGSPFVHYRNIYKIKRSKNAKGTVAFPAHSTNEVSTKYDIVDFCAKLKSLPSEYQPVTICLHFIDINKGLGDIYRAQGFRVVCAGNRHNINFVRTFYDIVKGHKYSLSNEVGSYTFYCAEMGIPFFILGKKPKAIMMGSDLNFHNGAELSHWKNGDKAMKLFDTGPIKNISSAQKEYVESEMGVNDCINPTQLKSLLVEHFWGDKYYLILPIYYLLNIYRKVARIT